jgi:UrcA family protein
MIKLATMALAAASLSLLTVAPAAAQDVQATVHYGDLDISSPAGAEALNTRLLGTVKSVCERPDMRDLKALTAWEACKDAAMLSALEQLSAKGAATVVAALG